MVSGMIKSLAWLNIIEVSDVLGYKKTICGGGWITENITGNQLYKIWMRALKSSMDPPSNVAYHCSPSKKEVKSRNVPS